MVLSLAEKLYALIREPDFTKKIARAQSLGPNQAEPVAALSPERLHLLKIPGRPNFFNLAAPREVAKRGFHDKDARIAFWHAIANIELLAIELPALCLLRFGANDPAFIQSQLKILAEEAYHFSLLQNKLTELGCTFGTLPSHNGLWDYAWKCENELEHQILIPCYLEARGLEATPEFIQKFKSLNDPKSAEILEIIERDEIQHVLAGQKYLAQKASEQNTTPDTLFQNTLTKFFGDKVKSKIKVHRENRLKAGFSEEMINQIEF